MLLSFDKRFLFVANSKTASTSIETALRPHAQIARLENAARKHVPVAQALFDYKDAFIEHDSAPERILKFGVMRDPIDWIGSWYRYRKGNKVANPLPADMSFADFWAAKDWNIRRPDGEKHLQRRMFCDGDEVLTDIIIPFSNLGPIFAEICMGLDMSVDTLPFQNRSKLTGTEGMTPELEAEMREYYAPDYALYSCLEEINAPALERLRCGFYATQNAM